MSERRRALLLLASTLAVLFIISEVGIRLVDPTSVNDRKPYEFDHLLRYRLKRDFEHTEIIPTRTEVKWVTNTNGFRGPAFSPGRSDRSARIVLLGDSCVFGIHNDEAHTIAALLSRRLRKAGSSAEVINAGVPGYTSIQSLMLLHTEVLDWKPDLIVLLVGWNDLGNSTFPFWEPNLTFQLSARNEPTPHGPTLMQDLRQIAKTSRLLRFVAERCRILLDRLQVSSGPDVEELAVLREQSGTTEFNDVALEIYKRNVRSIIRLARGEKAEVVLLTWPCSLGEESSEGAMALMGPSLRTFNVPVGLWREWTERYAVALREIASREDVELLDVARKFDQLDERERYFSDMMHLSDAGNELIAGFLAEHVLSKDP